MNAPPPPPIRRNEGSVVYTARRAAREASSRRVMGKLDVLSVGSNRTVGRACTGGRKVTREKTFLRGVYVFQLSTKMFRSFRLLTFD